MGYGLWDYRMNIWWYIWYTINLSRMIYIHIALYIIAYALLFMLYCLCFIVTFCARICNQCFFYIWVSTCGGGCECVCVCVSGIYLTYGYLYRWKAYSIKVCVKAYGMYVLLTHALQFLGYSSVFRGRWCLCVATESCLSVVF